MSSSTSLLDLLSVQQSGKDVTANDLFNAVSPASLYGRRGLICSGLVWGYYGGVVTLGSGSITTIANGTITLAANNTNYIVASAATGAVSSSTNTTNWNDTSNYYRLYSAVTGSSTVTSYTDVRELGKMTGALGSAGLTTANWAAARVYHVGQYGGMYASVDAALTAINAASPAPSSTNRVVILVWPGKYITSSTIAPPVYVGIRGISKGLVQFQNDTTDLFTLSGNNWLENFVVEGSSTSSVYAINCNNSSKCYIRNIDLSDNGGTARQKFLKQSGNSWTDLYLEHLVLSYYGTSGYAVLLENTAATARDVATEINDIFSDANQLTNYGGSFQIRGVQNARFRSCQIRGAATYNTGIRFELGGVTGLPEMDIRQSYLGGGGVPIYTESGTDTYIRNVTAFGALFDGTVSFRNSTIADTASVAVTSSDVTLKGQEHGSPYLTTTGTLTGNRNVIVPNYWDATVYCNNTGAYTTTFKTQSGTGVVVAQGKRAILKADGTNVVRVTADA